MGRGYNNNSQSSLSLSSSSRRQAGRGICLPILAVVHATTCLSFYSIQRSAARQDANPNQHLCGPIPDHSKTNQSAQSNLEKKITADI